MKSHNCKLEAEEKLKECTIKLNELNEKIKKLESIRQPEEIEKLLAQKNKELDELKSKYEQVYLEF